MSLYESYLEEIEERKAMGLNPKPIDDEALANEVISQIKDTENKHREHSLNYFIYNMLPGTTGAANAKAKFLKSLQPSTLLIPLSLRRDLIEPQ